MFKLTFMAKISKWGKKALIYLVHCSRLGNLHVEEKISLLPFAAPTSEDVHTSYNQRVWDALGKKQTNKKSYFSQKQNDSYQK